MKVLRWQGAMHLCFCGAMHGEHECQACRLTYFCPPYKISASLFLNRLFRKSFGLQLNVFKIYCDQKYFSCLFCLMQSHPCSFLHISPISSQQSRREIFLPCKHTMEATKLQLDWQRQVMAGFYSGAVVHLSNADDSIWRQSIQC